MKKNTIPTHIAIIMDGNRRWAREHGLSVNEGHRRVVFHVVENLVDHAIKRDIKYMTFWAWSTENWKRSKNEVEMIMRIFRTALHRQWKKLHKKGVRIKVIGDISKFSPDIRKAIEERIEETKKNNKITVIFALNYGGRDELRRAVQKFGANFEKYLDTADVPDPDMIIRPGGEQRLSGFLLWQSEYAELYFTKWYMPEFTPEKLDEAIEEYVHRQRRFGA